MGRQCAKCCELSLNTMGMGTMVFLIFLKTFSMCRRGQNMSESMQSLQDWQTLRLLKRLFLSNCLKIFKAIQDRPWLWVSKSILVFVLLVSGDDDNVNNRHGSSNTLVSDDAEFDEPGSRQSRRAGRAGERLATRLGRLGLSTHAQI